MGKQEPSMADELQKTVQRTAAAKEPPRKILRETDLQSGQKYLY